MGLSGTGKPGHDRKERPGCPRSAGHHAEEAGRNGHVLVIAGDPSHPEVRGITGWTSGPSIVVETPEDVEATADRLYVGALKYDPRHWYRMQHHFPVIDEDNYDRFAALVIADLSAGPLHEAARDGDNMLLVGEVNPLIMSEEERRSQKVRTVKAGDLMTGSEEE